MLNKEKALVMILAGGEGKRLYPLTRDRAKPAVPFGGRYRIIDFVLNNFVNSGFYKIKVLTQYKSDSLNKHITRGWGLSTTTMLNQFVDLVPAQMRTDGNWYKGTADAVFQNINQIIDEDPSDICIFGGDHVYKMNISLMYQFHKKINSDLTISAIPVNIEDADQFGIIEVDCDYKLVGFAEKPSSTPKSIPGNNKMCLASMGNYIFKTNTLIEELMQDSISYTSSHDFGKDIIPNMIRNKRNVYVYDFSKNHLFKPYSIEKSYWRDVGTVDAYYRANMDLICEEPELNLYSKDWPIRTFNYNYPPAKFVCEDNNNIGLVTNSLVSEGCIISGGSISNCILSPQVIINNFSNVSESILMENVCIGKNCEIKKAIIDKNVSIPPNTKIGIDNIEDKKRGFFVSENGVVVVPKGAIL